MTALAKVGDTVRCNCGCDGELFVVASISGDRAESADGVHSAYVSECDVVMPARAATGKQKATAAELREAFIRDHHSVGYVRGAIASLDDIIAAARAEAVAPVMDVLRQLVDALPRCDERGCDALATFVADDAALMSAPYCENHGYDHEGDEYTRRMPVKHAQALRLALALLGVEP